MRVSPLRFAMYEGIARWPCVVHHAKQERRAFIPGSGRRIFFEKAGINVGFAFRAPLLFVPASQKATYWEQLRASPRRKEQLFVAFYGTTEVVP